MAARCVFVAVSSFRLPARRMPHFDRFGKAHEPLSSLYHSQYQGRFQLSCVLPLREIVIYRTRTWENTIDLLDSLKDN